MPHATQISGSFLVPTVLATLTALTPWTAQASTPVDLGLYATTQSWTLGSALTGALFIAGAQFGATDVGWVRRQGDSIILYTDATSGMTEDLEYEWPIELTEVFGKGGLTVQVATNPLLEMAGGTLQISNFHIHAPSRAVFADIEGSNGVGLHEHVRLFNIEGQLTRLMFGPDHLPVWDMSDLGAKYHLTGLMITDEAFSLVAGSLGLQEGKLGYRSFQAARDWGVFHAGPVPEPATVTITMTGLMIAGLAASRRRRRPSTTH